MIFENEEHESLYEKYMLSMPSHDCYHKALAYLMALLDDMGDSHGIRIYDKVEDCIKPEVLHEGWQTGSSKKATRLAFNLFTDGSEWTDDLEHLTPVEVFADAQWRQYFFEAVKIRFEDVK